MPEEDDRAQRPRIPASTAREMQREATRAALLDAAMTLFHDRGYIATTADDVAAAIGQTKGAFYFHFTSKEDCFLDVLRHREQLRKDWYRLPEQHDARTTSLDDVLRRTMSHLAALMGGRPSFALAMADFWLAVQPSPSIASRFAAIYAGWIEEITRFVETLQAGDWVAHDLDARAAAAQMLAMIDGLSIHGRLYGTDRLVVAFEGLRKLLRP